MAEHAATITEHAATIADQVATIGEQADTIAELQRQLVSGARRVQHAVCVHCVLCCACVLTASNMVPGLWLVCCAGAGEGHPCGRGGSCSRPTSTACRRWRCRRCGSSCSRRDTSPGACTLRSVWGSSVGGMCECWRG